MKILMLHCTYQYKGGEDTVVEEEMKLLSLKGHKVELLQFSNSGNELQKVLQIPFNISAYNKTKQVLRRFKPDVVHIHNLHFGASPSVIYAIAKHKTPFVNTLHNYRLLCPSGTLFFNEKPFLDSLKQSFPWSAVTKGVYRNSKVLTFWLAFSMKLHQWLGTWKLCSKYIVLTDYAKQMLLQSSLKLKNEQIAVKPNFCYAPAYKNFTGGKHFLFVGRLTIEKGVRLLLNTFSALDCEIRIAGDGPLKDEVISFSARFSNIKFLGSLDKQGVFEQLQTSSALIFPSIWFEGMPLIIIEAFSAGTPVIASKLGAMDSMITPGYNGFHFQPESQEDLSKQVNNWNALSEKEKLVFRHNAEKSYEQFYSPGSNAKQLIAIYNSVVSAPTTSDIALPHTNPL
ncbi:MAG TPA: glycosyltransferase family 4 protein [Segetibacter sp.]